MTAGFKDKDMLAALFEQDDLLLCAVPKCAGILSVLNMPAPTTPTDTGWALKHGWWLCPEHSGWNDFWDSIMKQPDQ